MRDYEKKQRKENRERTSIEYPKFKRCYKCKEEKPGERFSKLRSSNDGLAVRCKDCDKVANAKNYRTYIDYFKEYAKENKERYLAHARRWGQRHPESHARRRVRRDAREQLNGGSFTFLEWKQKLSLYPNCPACGIPWSKELRPTVDHITPVSRGGGNSIGNIQPLCFPCNIRKGTKIIRYEIEGGASKPANGQPL